MVNLDSMLTTLNNYHHTKEEAKLFYIDKRLEQMNNVFEEELQKLIDRLLCENSGDLIKQLGRKDG